MMEIIAWIISIFATIGGIGSLIDNRRRWYERIVYYFNLQVVDRKARVGFEEINNKLGMVFEFSYINPKSEDVQLIEFLNQIRKGKRKGRIHIYLSNESGIVDVSNDPFSTNIQYDRQVKYRLEIVADGNDIETFLPAKRLSKPYQVKYKTFV